MSAFERWKDGIVVELARCKRAGMTFEVAWTVAMRVHPPRPMDMGPARPTFEDEVGVVDFFRDACRDAWHGRRCELADLPTALRNLGRDWPRVGVGEGRPLMRQR